MKGDLQVSVSIQCAKGIVSIIVVIVKSSLLLSPRSSRSREQSCDFLSWSEQEQIAHFSTRKKKLAVVFACYTELSTWIVSNCSLSICKKKISHAN